MATKKKQKIDVSKYQQGGNIIRKILRPYDPTNLDEIEVVAPAPAWLRYKREYEQNNPKEKFIESYLNPFAKSLGNTKTNYPKRLDEEYEKQSLDYVAEQLLDPAGVGSFKTKTKADRLALYDQFSDKEREIIKNSKYANRFLPAERENSIRISDTVQNKNKSKSVVDYSAEDVGLSVEGTPNRFRLAANARTNFEDYINPGIWVGEMAKNLGQSLAPAQNGDIKPALAAVAAPLVFGAMGFSPLHALDKGIKKGLTEIIAKKDLYQAGYDAGNLGAKINPITSTLTKEEYNKLRDIQSLKSLAMEPNVERTTLVKRYLKSSLDDTELKRLTSKTRAELEEELNGIATAKKIEEQGIQNLGSIDLRREYGRYNRREQITQELRRLPVPPIDRSYSYGSDFDFNQIISRGGYTTEDWQHFSNILNRGNNNRGLGTKFMEAMDMPVVDILPSPPNISRMVYDAGKKRGIKNTKINYDENLVPLNIEGESAKPLLPTLFKTVSDHKGVMRKIGDAFESLKTSGPGSFDASGSLSDSSAPLYYLKASTLSNKPNIAFEVKGFSPLNDFGHLKKAGVSNEKLVDFINTHISKLEFNGKKLPAAYLDKNGEVQIPELVIKKFQQGGYISQNDMKKRKGFKNKNYQGGGQIDYRTDPPEDDYSGVGDYGAPPGDQTGGTGGTDVPNILSQLDVLAGPILTSIFKGDQAEKNMRRSDVFTPIQGFHGYAYQQGGKVKPKFEEFLKEVNPEFSDTTSYNLREAYNELPLKVLDAWKKNPDKHHLPDTYKLPNHPSFSIESKYYKPGMKSGYWIGEKYIPLKEGQLPPKDYQLGGIINTTGYTPGFPSFDNPENIIPLNSSKMITMENTPFPVLAIPDVGDPVILKPGEKRRFKDATQVREIPMKDNKISFGKFQQGGAPRGGNPQEKKLPNTFNNQIEDDYPLSSFLPFILGDSRNTLNAGQRKLVPIQTEKGEYISSPLGDLVKVAATKSHKQMEDDDITDHTAEGNYIFSDDDKKMSIKKGKEGGEVKGIKLKDVIIGTDVMYYEEGKMISTPKNYTLGDMEPGKSKYTYAEIADNINKKFPVTDREKDIFAKRAQVENKQSRIPYINSLIELSEIQKQSNNKMTSPMAKFRQGGFASMAKIYKPMMGALSKQIEDGNTNNFYFPQDPMLNKKMDNNFKVATYQGGGPIEYDDRNRGQNKREQWNYWINQTQDHYNDYADYAKQGNKLSSVINAAGILGQSAYQGDNEYLYGNQYNSRLDNLANKQDRSFNAEQNYYTSLVDRENSAYRLGMNSGADPNQFAPARANAIREQNSQVSNLNKERRSFADRYGVMQAQSSDMFAGRQNQQKAYLNDFSNNRIQNLAGVGSNYVSQDVAISGANLEAQSKLQLMKQAGNGWTDFTNGLGDAINAITGLVGAFSGFNFGGGGNQSQQTSAQQAQMTGLNPNNWATPTFQYSSQLYDPRNPWRGYDPMGMGSPYQPSWNTNRGWGPPG